MKLWSDKLLRPSNKIISIKIPYKSLSLLLSELLVFVFFHGLCKMSGFFLFEWNMNEWNMNEKDDDILFLEISTNFLFKTNNKDLKRNEIL